MSGAYPRVEHLERLARNKHSSLLWKGVTYSRKKFYSIDTRCSARPWIIPDGSLSFSGTQFLGDLVPGLDDLLSWREGHFLQMIFSKTILKGVLTRAIRNSNIVSSFLPFHELSCCQVLLGQSFTVWYTMVKIAISYCVIVNGKKVLQTC